MISDNNRRLCIDINIFVFPAEQYGKINSVCIMFIKRFSGIIFKFIRNSELRINAESSPFKQNFRIKIKNACFFFIIIKQSITGNSSVTLIPVSFKRRFQRNIIRKADVKRNAGSKLVFCNVAYKIRFILKSVVFGMIRSVQKQGCLSG